LHERHESERHSHAVADDPLIFGKRVLKDPTLYGAYFWLFTVVE
jgi:hypothetical protein